MSDPAYVDLTPVTPLGAYGDYAGGTSVYDGEAAAELPTNLGNQFDASGNDLVLAYNSGDRCTVTITSVANEWGRTQDISKSVGAGKLGVFGPFRHPGWTQTDGHVYLSADSTSVLFFVLRL